MKAQGFSLLELMFTILIMAILAGIATPYYQRHTQKAHITDGQVKLMELMRLQQRYFVRNLSYTDTMDTDFNQQAENANIASNHGFYHITAESCADNLSTCIRLTAKPVKPSNPTLTLDSAGRRTPEDIW